MILAHEAIACPQAFPFALGAALDLALRHTDGRPRLVSAMLVTQPLPEAQAVTHG